MIINNERFPDVGIKRVKFAKPCKSLDYLGTVEFESGTKFTCHVETMCEAFARVANAVIAYAKSHKED